jgi:hypothetical protein
MCAGGSCIQAVNLTVKTQNVQATNTQWVYFDIEIINNGTTAIPLSQLTGRYWYTLDDAAMPTVTQAAACDFAMPITGACANVTETFVTMTTPLADADHYLQFGFAAAAGNLAAGATASIEFGFHKNDWSVFTRTNDYSYNSATTYSTVTTVTMYITTTSGTALVYGTEPVN